MKTVIYVRVSTNDQTTENQLPDLEAGDACLRRQLDAEAKHQEEEPATVLDGGPSSLAGAVHRSSVRGRSSGGASRWSSRRRPRRRNGSMSRTPRRTGGDYRVVQGAVKLYSDGLIRLTGRFDEPVLLNFELPDVQGRTSNLMPEQASRPSTTR